MAWPDVSGETRLAAVVGNPVRHSVSPRIHNAAFKALELNWRYVALEVDIDRAGSIVEAMRTLGISGMNVTMPFKDAAAASADRLTPTAHALQTCNTLYWDGTEIVGHSTDGDGYINSFESQSSVDLSSTRVCVIGTGGAARSIVEALGRKRGVEIVVAGRSISKAEEAASLASQAEATTVSDHDAMADCPVIINATSVGMDGGPNPGGIPLPERIISNNHTVSDIVYYPRVTPLLEAAASKGAATVGGLGMLAHQAALSFGLWTGQIAPIDVMIAQIERPS